VRRSYDDDNCSNHTVWTYGWSPLEDACEGCYVCGCGRYRCQTPEAHVVASPAASPRSFPTSDGDEIDTVCDTVSDCSVCEMVAGHSACVTVAEESPCDTMADDSSCVTVCDTMCDTVCDTACDTTVEGSACDTAAEVPVCNTVAEDTVRGAMCDSIVEGHEVALGSENGGTACPDIQSTEAHAGSPERAGVPELLTPLGPGNASVWAVALSLFIVISSALVKAVTGLVAWGRSLLH
jgi:hypothetical protein